MSQLIKKADSVDMRNIINYIKALDTCTIIGLLYSGHDGRAYIDFKNKIIDIGYESLLKVSDEQINKIFTIMHNVIYVRNINSLGGYMNILCKNIAICERRFIGMGFE